MSIPFTTEQFFEVIANYNIAVFPIQILLVLAGIVCVAFLYSKKSYKDKIIGSYLGILWLWIGVIYHLVFFTVINPAAYIFGILFILQGLLILIETFRNERLKFNFKAEVIGYVAYFILVFAIIIYPIFANFFCFWVNRSIFIITIAHRKTADFIIHIESV